MVKKKTGDSCRGVYKLLATLLLLIMATGAYAAEQKPKIELKNSAAKEIVRIKDGRQIVELLPVVKTARGDILVYTVSYRNSGQSEARNVTVVDPIPEGATYMPGSAAGQNSKILFSINGGATYIEPPVLYKSLDASGKEITGPASPEMYTHVKWIVQVPLKPGETGKASFKVKVK